MSDTEQYSEVARLECAGRIGSWATGWPVAGIVMEDMDGDGVPNQYPFRDGVTVTIAGLNLGAKGAPNPEQTMVALTGQPLSAKRFARIASTTREQLLASKVDTTEAAVAGLGWLGVVRAAYQRAWDSDENVLISAWALSNVKFLTAQEP